MGLHPDKARRISVIYLFALFLLFLTFHRFTKTITVFLEPVSHAAQPTDPEHRSRFSVNPDDKSIDDLPRYHLPKELQTFPLTRALSCNRAVSSPIGNASSDGLGHRLLMVVYELNLATYMRVGYLHRVTEYGSLTASNPDAVQTMFGWKSYPDIRDEVLRRECDVGLTQAQPGRSDFVPYCRNLKNSSSFRHIVRVPARISDCFVDNNWRECESRLRRFAEKYDRCDTLFQTMPTRHSFQYRSGHVHPFLNWLRGLYWRSHASRTALLPAAALRSRDALSNIPNLTLDTITAAAIGTATRMLKFNESRLQVVVHVRRGDFFVHSNRIMLADAKYAAMVARGVAQARAYFGRPVGVDVSIYSEGAPADGKVKSSNHDIADMTSVYMTETGARVADVGPHWKRNLAAAGLRKDVRVQPFIATDTISAVHAMICADVFIGSFSGMSFVVAANLGRGVLLLPWNGTRQDIPQQRRIWADVSQKGSRVWIREKNLKRAFEQAFPNGELD